MSKGKLSKLLVMGMAVALVLSACGSKNNGEAGADLAKLKIQLKWVPQAQFAGYYVAKEKGFYEEEGIDASIVPGGPDVIMEQQVANGAADIGITGVDSLLVSIDNGLPLVSIAQTSQTSSNLLISKKSSGIDSFEKMKGKKVGSWMGSQQFQILAFLEKEGLNPKEDVSIVKQGFTMDQFFNDQLDVASATTYNEYPVVLESGVKPEELNVFRVEDGGLAMLEDTIFAKTDWVKDNRELAVKAVRATLKGWKYANENQDEAVDIVMKNVQEGSTTREHQATMLKEILKLILPEGFTEEQIGTIPEDKFQTTADIALKYGLIKKAADLTTAYDKTIVEEANKTE
jgi:NitT/TauT family transport system substrate-binding protein